MFPNKSTVSLPANVKDIDSNIIYKFYRTDSIKVDSGNAVYSSYDGCLYNKDQTELIMISNKKILSIPVSVTKINMDIDYMLHNVDKITVDAANTKYSSYDGSLYNKKQTQLLIYPNKKADIKISKNLKTLDFDVLSGGYYLTEITIPKNVKTIKNHINSSVLIYCEENSAAHKYAVENNVSYSLTSGKNMISIPSNVKVKKKSASSASISWKKISGVEGYEIFCSTQKNSEFKKIATIDKVNKISYVNKRLSKGTTYYYKIRAYKTISGINVYSGYSKVSKIQM